MTVKSARISGINMRWDERGEGLPVVLIHGIPTGPELWRHVMPLLSGVRCLAWEMVGYGSSIPEGRNAEISVSRQATYLAAWLSELGIRRAVLAGHDLGGGVAQIASVRVPSLCAGLFLTNAIGYDSWPIPSVKAMQVSSPLVRRLPDPVFRLIFTTFIRRGHDKRARADEAIRTHWPHYQRHGGAEAFIRQVNALNVKDTLDVASELPRLAVPARIVWGAEDQFQQIAYGERLERDLKAPLRRIEGGKHFTPEDHPNVIAEEITRLVRDVKQI